MSRKPNNRTEVVALFEFRFFFVFSIRSIILIQNDLFHFIMLFALAVGDEQMVRIKVHITFFLDNVYQLETK